jgi:hypothetical protein
LNFFDVKRGQGIFHKLKRQGSTTALPFFLIQDELETVPLCPNLSISVRNLAFIGVKGISRIQLVFAHP